MIQIEPRFQTFIKTDRMKRKYLTANVDAGIGKSIFDKLYSIQ